MCSRCDANGYDTPLAELIELGDGARSMGLFVTSGWQFEHGRWQQSRYAKRLNSGGRVRRDGGLREFIATSQGLRPSEYALRKPVDYWAAVAVCPQCGKLQDLVPEVPDVRVRLSRNPEITNPLIWIGWATEHPEGIDYNRGPWALVPVSLFARTHGGLVARAYGCG